MTRNVSGMSDTLGMQALVSYFKETAAQQSVYTGRWGFCGVFEYFSGFEFFLLPKLVHARPPASSNYCNYQEPPKNNKIRWAVSIHL